MTLYGDRLAYTNKLPWDDEKSAHISDNIRIDELTFILPNQLPTTNAMPVVAVG